MQNHHNYEIRFWMFWFKQTINYLYRYEKQIASYIVGNNIFPSEQGCSTYSGKIKQLASINANKRKRETFPILINDLNTNTFKN